MKQCKMSIACDAIKKLDNMEDLNIVIRQVKLTQKEYDFLNQIVKSDYSTDGQGFVDYITDFDYTMKTVRGLIPSLVEQGVISYDE